MGQNITWLGASYSGVEQVTLPKTGGGTCTFYESGGGGTPVVTVVDTLDVNGGTIRDINAVDISDSTVTAADVLNSKWFYTAAGVKTQGTATGGGGGATQHTIHLEFSDSTDTDIEVDYDDSLIGTMITAYTPATYSGKTVTLAQLDGVTWYNPAVIPLNTELVDISEVVENYAIGDDGAEEYNNGSYCSDFMPIDPSMTFSFVQYRWYNVAFYDAGKTFISALFANNIATSYDGEYAHGTLSGARIPSTAAYVRLSSYPTYNASNTYMSYIRTS